MIFGKLNLRKFDMRILQTCHLHLSIVATLLWEIQKKITFNRIIHIHFWLFMLSQKKTNCNPLAHPTWKCHHTNLWIAKLFLLTEGLLRSFKRWMLWKEPVVIVVGGSEKNRFGCVATGMSGKQCHSKCSELPPSASSLYQHLSVAKSTTLYCSAIQPMSQQAAATSRNMSISIHALLL